LKGAAAEPMSTVLNGLTIVLFDNPLSKDKISLIGSKGSAQVTTNRVPV